MRRAFAPLLVFVIMTIIAESALTYLEIPKFILPKPSLVLKTLIEQRSWFIDSLNASMQEAVVGFVLGIVLGVSLALTCLFIPRLEAIILPLAIALRNVPFVAISPILSVVFGYGKLPKILIVMIVSFFPIMVNFIAGLASADKGQLERFFVLRATRWQLFTKLQLPSSIPSLVVGMEIAVSNIIIAAIVGEMLGTQKGLGFLILMAITSYQYPALMGAVIVTTLASILVTVGFTAITRRLLSRWL